MAATKGFGRNPHKWWQRVCSSWTVVHYGEVAAVIERSLPNIVIEGDKNELRTAEGTSTKTKDLLSVAWSEEATKGRELYPTLCVEAQDFFLLCAIIWCCTIFFISFHF